MISVVFVGSSGEAARVATERKPSSFVQQLSICPAIHPSASVYSHTKIKPAEQIRHAFVHTTVIFGAIFPFSLLEYIHRILLSSQLFFFPAVSIQHFLFAFLISLSVCFCLFSVAFQLLHLTRFGFFYFQHLVLTAYLTLYYTTLLSHIGHCYLYPSLDLNQDEFQMSSNCF